MQDNFNLKGFLRNNKLLNEGIGGYFDLKPLKEGRDWDEDNVGRLADKALYRMGKSKLKAKVGDWISSKLSGPEKDTRFVNLLNQNDGEGEDALGDAIIADYESDQDEEMNELNDLGNMEEKEGDSMIFEKSWQYDWPLPYDDDEEDSFAPAQKVSANYDRLLDLGGDQIKKGIISLVQDGFDEKDILDFVKTVLKDNANTGEKKKSPY